MTSLAIPAERALMKKLFAFFSLSLMALILSPFSAKAATVTVDVDASDNFTSTGVYLTAGQSFTISATGKVDLSVNNGSYITDPDGLILTAPDKGTGAYGHFFHKDGSAIWGTGGYRLIDGPDGEAVNESAPFVQGEKYGVLVGFFSSSENAAQIDDLASYLILGSSGVYKSLVSGWLYLVVNDINRHDNLGTYSVAVSTVPLPAALPLFGLGLAGLAVRARRSKKAAAAA